MSSSDGRIVAEAAHPSADDQRVAGVSEADDPRANAKSDHVACVIRFWRHTSSTGWVSIGYAFHYKTPHAYEATAWGSTAKCFAPSPFGEQPPREVGAGAEDTAARDTSRQKEGGEISDL